jgi:hypothetical protein
VLTPDTRTKHVAVCVVIVVASVAVRTESAV